MLYVCSKALVRRENSKMKRRILLVDDEVAVLLTLKAVLEISGFDVDTAASGREGVSRLHTHEYHMLITDMRMENDAAGREVIHAARAASYQPAIALLTAFPVADEDWQEMGADKLLVKPMHTRILLEQIEALIDSHEKKLADQPAPASAKIAKKAAPKKLVASKKLVPAKKTAATQAARKVSSPKTSSANASKPRVAAKPAAKKSANAKRPTAKA